MMTESHNLDQAFHYWRDEHESTMKPAAPGDQLNQHLTQPSLLRLAADHGLAEAQAHELEHLDSCSLCLEQWAAWRRAMATAAEHDNAETDDINQNDELNQHFPELQTYGYLEAAADTAGISQALTLESHCGCYRLEILPDRQKNNTGMIILHKLIDNPAAEVTVRDRNGIKVLSGSFENNRLARIHHQLDQLDLSMWTVG